MQDWVDWSQMLVTFHRLAKVIHSYIISECYLLSLNELCMILDHICNFQYDLILIFVKGDVQLIQLDVKLVHGLVLVELCDLGQVCLHVYYVGLR